MVDYWSALKSMFQDLRQSEPMVRSRITKSFSHSIPSYVLRPQCSFTHQARFEERLRESMTQPLCGVRILCAPEGTGKSAFMISVANEMLEQKQISGAYYIANYTDAFEHKTLHNWLLSKFEITPRPNFASFCSLLPDKSAKISKPYLLILDQFEDVLRHEDSLTFIKSLAQDCQKK